MSLPMHTVDVVPAGASQGGNGLQNAAKVVVGKLDSVANAAGTAAGSTVTTAVTFNNELPANYAVMVLPNQNADAWVSNKTSSGFNVNLAPPGVNGQLTAGGAISNASTTITMAATIPQWVVKGMNVYDVTAAVQIGTVSSISGTTLTLAANAANNGSGSSDVLQFGFLTVASGTFDVLVVA